LQNIVNQDIAQNIINLENKSFWDNYDFLIENNGTLVELEKKAISAIKDLLFYYKQNRNQKE
jgi:hypothetical protein